MHKSISLQMNILKTLTSIIFFLVLLILVSCNQQENDRKDIILATVGNEQITVQDFRRNYEFGLPHLKSEPNRKL